MCVTRCLFIVKVPLLVGSLLTIAVVSIRTAQGETAVMRPSAVVSLDGSAWLLATDPKNVGREQNWSEKPVQGAKPAQVPCLIEAVFPGYHGVAWYWHDFTAPANPHPQGRYLLRFWNVDYLGDVWVNGVHVGKHEGANDPFVLDVTDAIEPGARNCLAVRILNPISKPIDGIRLQETAHTCKRDDSLLDWGGIMDSVELLVSPAVRVEDLFVRPALKTGTIRVQANLRNAARQPVLGRIVLGVSPAAGGETVAAAHLERTLPPGDTLIETELKVEQPRLWELNDPYLYRVTVRAGAGFRDVVRRAVGALRVPRFPLPRRLFPPQRPAYLRESSHMGPDVPIDIVAARDPELFRRDLLNNKAMGFNMVRFITGIPPHWLLDFCDEIGLLVYQENFASWCMEPSPKLAERFNRSTLAMVKRDRNHPSVVAWGLLNETPNGPVADQGVAALPLVRALDDTRMVMLNCGGWDNAGKNFANPGSKEWESAFDDLHPYQPLPHDAAVIKTLRTIGGPKPLWLSEYGVYSGVNLERIMRQFEQRGKASSFDADAYRRLLDAFMADWNRWNLGDTFVSPDDYFRQCVAWVADLRKLGTSAIRANPNVIGHSLTSGAGDPCTTGEGLTTAFRELKPGVIDAMFDAWYPLRWCLFVEPVQVHRGRKARLEAVLANEGVLAPGDYPVRFQVVGPRNVSVFDKTISIKVPDPKSKPEPKFAQLLFAEDAVINGPSGKYRFLAAFEKGAAAAGGDVAFYVADPAEMPAVEAEVTLWGDDADLAKWLREHGVKTRAFAAGAQTRREVILVGNRPAAGEAVAFRELARHVARGSRAVFLCPEVFQKDNDRTRWLPLANKGNRTDLPVLIGRKDDWTKHHPIFAGLPAGCVMDHTFYREVFPLSGWSGQDVPAEVVAGAINTSCWGSQSGLTVAVYDLGVGRFTLNTLRIRENLGSDPVAERLIRNMLRYAARDVKQLPADLPEDFDGQMKAMHY